MCPTRVVYLLQLMSLHWYIIIIWSPQFTLGFTHSVVHSVDIVDSFGFSIKWLCHLWTKTVLFPPSQSVSPFFFLVLLHKQGLPVWCWKGVDILALYLIWVGELCSFHHCMMLALGFLYQLEEVPLYSYITESFHHGWEFHFVKYFFCIYWYDHVFFSF